MIIFYGTVVTDERFNSIIGVFQNYNCCGWNKHCWSGDWFLIGYVFFYLVCAERGGDVIIVMVVNKIDLVEKRWSLTPIIALYFSSVIVNGNWLKDLWRWIAYNCCGWLMKVFFELGVLIMSNIIIISRLQKTIFMI